MATDPKQQAIERAQAAKAAAEAEQAAFQAAAAAADAAGRAAEAARQRLAAQQASLEILQQNLTIAKNQATVDGETLLLLRQQIEQLQKTVDLEKQRLNLSKEAATVLKGLSGINDSFTNRFIANMIKNRDVVGSLQGVASELETTFGSAEGKAQVMASMLMKAGEAARGLMNTAISATKNLALAQDTAYAGFAKMTGQTGALRSEMVGLERSMFQYGVAIDGALKTQSALFSIVTQFTQMTARERSELGQTTALLDRFGVGAEVTARNLQVMTTQMGMGASEAAGFSTQLYTFAQQSGIATTKVANDFAALAPQLTVFGDRAGHVFMQLEMASKQSGFAIERLVGVADGFNRFDTAADSVGRLNAILGGPYLSTIQMVMTTNPVERMQMLSDAVNRAGKSFDQLAYYEKLSLVEGLKLQNVGELALLMRGQFQLLDQSVMMTGQQFEDLARQEREYNSVLDEYKQIVRSLAADLLPLVRTLGNMLGVIAEHPGVFKAITAATFGTIAAFKAFTVLLPVLSAGASAAGLALGSLTFGLGAAALAAGALFGAFTKSGSPKFYEMPFQMASGFNAMASGAASAAQGVGMLGASVQGVSQAMSELPDVKVAQFKTIMSETRRVTEEVSSAGAGPASLAIGVARAAAASSGGYGPGGTGGTTVPVNIYLDGDQIRSQIFRGLSPV